jgi:hypothetical protein
VREKKKNREKKVVQQQQKQTARKLLIPTYQTCPTHKTVRFLRIEKKTPTENG